MPKYPENLIHFCRPVLEHYELEDEIPRMFVRSMSSHLHHRWDGLVSAQCYSLTRCTASSYSRRSIPGYRSRTSSNARGVSQYPAPGLGKPSTLRCQTESVGTKLVQRGPSRFAHTSHWIHGQSSRRYTMLCIRRQARSTTGVPCVRQICCQPTLLRSPIAGIWLR